MKIFPRSVPRSVLGLAAAGFCLWGAGVPAHAADTTVLRMADSLPNGSFIYKLVAKPFMDEVEKRTDGKVTFKYFPSQQLGKAKDMLKLTQTGMADIGYVGPGYIQDKMPLSQVFELPGAFSDDSCQGFTAFWDMTHDGGYLQVNEWDPNGVIPILSLITRHHIYISNSKPINTLDDLKGLKLRSSGGAMASTMQEMGLVPVNISAPETYESMQRGTVDGAFYPAQSAFDYGLTDLIKSGTTSRHVAGVVLTYAISKDAWNKLDPETQQIILDVGREISTTSCRGFDAAEQDAIERMSAQGIKKIHFDEADGKRIDEAFERSSQAWAKSLDERGKPGSDTLAAMRKAVAAVQ
ncbi:MAG: TRAP transporter substrate-binding protein DctP [Burkholderiaceae bacterium]|uniref:TRAP transporter substrate-binding protein n=1 Tax=Castellaniella sp. TaxID=1955812 RepID=UPI00355E9065